MNVGFIRVLLSSTDRSTKALRQVVYSFGFKGISILTGIIYVPLLIDILDKERYGIWVTLLSVFSWFIVFDGGLGNGLRNRLAESIAANDYSLGRKYVSTAYLLMGIISLILALTFFILNSQLNWSSILNTSDVPSHELYLLTSIVFGFLMLRFCLQVIVSILLADQKPAFGNGLGTLWNLFSLITIWIVYKSSDSMSLLSLGAIISASPVIVLLISSVIAFKGPYKRLRPSPKLINFSLIPSLLGLGIQFLLMQIGALVQYASANVVISRYFGPAEVTVYNVVYQYMQVPIVLMIVIVSPIWSAVTDAYALKDYGWMKSTLMKLRRVSLAFSLVIFLMVIAAPSIYRVWIGDRITVPKELTILMGVYAILSVWLAPYSSYINGLGKLRITSALSLPMIGIYIILVISLTRLIEQSISVVLSMCIIVILWLFIQPLQTHKILSGKASGVWMN